MAQKISNGRSDLVPSVFEFLCLLQQAADAVLLSKAGSVGPVGIQVDVITRGYWIPSTPPPVEVFKLRRVISKTEDFPMIPVKFTLVARVLTQDPERLIFLVIACFDACLILRPIKAMHHNSFRSRFDHGFGPTHYELLHHATTNRTTRFERTHGHHSIVVSRIGRSAAGITQCKVRHRTTPLYSKASLNCPERCVCFCGLGKRDIYYPTNPRHP